MLKNILKFSITCIKNEVPFSPINFVSEEILEKLLWFPEHWDNSSISSAMKQTGIFLDKKIRSRHCFQRGKNLPEACGIQTGFLIQLTSQVGTRTASEEINPPLNNMLHAQLIEFNSHSKPCSRTMDKQPCPCSAVGGLLFSLCCGSLNQMHHPC